MIIVGADVGQKIDPTAIAVAEPEFRTSGGRYESHQLVRFLERLPLGTPYPKACRRIHEIMGKLRERDPDVTLFVDATGVGVPVVDILRELDEDPVPCKFTAGDRYIVDYDDGEIRIGKSWLVSKLQALLQMRRLHLPETEEARAAVEELQNFEIKIDRQTARETSGAFRTGTHDDLVTAIGLAVHREIIDASVTSRVMAVSLESTRRGGAQRLFGTR